MFLRFLILSAGNLVVFLLCYLRVAHAPGGGVEGLGSALLGFVSLFISLLLSGFGMNQIYAELRQGRPSVKAVLSTAFAIAPLVIFAVAQHAERARGLHQ